MKYDVMIVGAGPAGLSAARVLSSAGKNVVVLEANKNIGKKVCAGGLTSKDLRYSIPKDLIERSFDRITINTPKMSGTIYAKEPFVMTISREDLGKWMATEAENAGSKIITNTKVTEVKDNYIIANGKQYRYTHLIGADGPLSLVRRYLNLHNNKMIFAMHYIVPTKTENIELFVDLKRFGPAYAWIFPHKNTMSVGIGCDPKYNNMDRMKKEFDRWCIENGFDIANAAKARFESAPINYDYRGHEFGNIFLVGDAAGLAYGFTGEGIYQAIASGEDVARKIIDPAHECKSIAEIVRKKQRMDKTLAKLVKNDRMTRFLSYLFIIMIKMKVFNKLFLRRFA